MIGRLPTTLVVGDCECEIRTDFRDILMIIEAYNDPELAEGEKILIMLTILYKDLHEIPRDCYQEAACRAVRFLDCGQESDDKKAPHKLMDWEQDESILFPAINKVAGKEVRASEYIHWWTFMGYFMEIEEGTFSTVLNIRQKKARGKKMEKWEQDFYRNNKGMCDIKTRYTEEEQAEKDYWDRLLG